MPPLSPALLAPVLAALVAGASIPAAAAPKPSASGQEVVDDSTHLVWARCLVGQRWDGQRCAGQPELLRQNEALARARALAQQTGQPWRLPRVPELQRLLRRGGDGLDPKLFPGAPDDWHWSATPSLQRESVNPYKYSNVMRDPNGQQAAPDSSFINGWAVQMGDGRARGDVPRSSKLAVRLVRAER